MSQRCPDCRNEFVQPFVCTTCGAQKLYDATLKSAQDEIERLRALLVECRPSMVEHRKRVEQDLTNAAYFPGRYPETLKALNTERDICDALLDRIDAAVKR